MLAGPLGLDENDLRDKLASGRRYIVLKKDVPEATAMQLENRLAVRSIRGITFEQDAERIYPNGTMACHVIGFMNGDHKGVQGIEAQEDQYLRGHEGFRYTRAGPRGEGAGGVSRRGARAAGWLQRAADDRHELAEHRRDGAGRGVQAIQAEEGDRDHDAPADGRNPGDGEPAEL